ncbi:MAG: MFS transporter [Actinomycetota bacterium]|nr:MFS transporter [Actinomycetota bacterium]
MTTDGRTVHGWKRNNYAATLAVALVATTFSFTAPFLPLYLQQLSGLTGPEAAMWAGIATGLGGFFMFVAGPIWGALGDRYGRKAMLVRACFGGAVGLLLIGLATSVWQIVMIRAFIGFMAGAGPAGMALVSASTPPDQISRYLGRFQGGVMAGTGAGPVIASVLIAIWSYKTTFIIGGVLMFSGTVVAMLMIKEPARAPIVASLDGVPKASGFKSIMASPIARSALILVLLLGLAAPMIQPILPTFVVSMLPADANNTAIIGWLFFAIAVSMAIGAVYSGRILSRIAHTRVLLWSTIGIAAFLIPMIFVQNIAVFALLLIGMSLFAGMLATGSASLLPTLVSAAALSAIFGLYQSVQALSGQIAPAFGGVIAAHLGYSWVFAIAAATLLFLGLPMYHYFKKVVRTHGNDPLIVESPVQAH